MKSSRPRFALLALAAGALLLAALPPARAAAPEGRPFVAKIHADWCGTCIMLDPTWQRIEKELGGRARPVTFDVTDRARLERSARLADELGLRAFFDRYKGRTGVVAVLAPDGEPLAVFTGELDFDAYAEAVAEAGRS